MRDIALEGAFPKLSIMGYELTSPSSKSYNCIAWAADDDKRFWWPNPDGFWPEGVPREETLGAFIAAFTTLGYAMCQDGDVVEGIEKVALYAIDGKPKHAARQLESGKWTSKCGKSVDISHTLQGIAGNLYGKPAAFLERQRQDSPQDSPTDK